MTLRILLFVAPVTAAWVTRRVCLSLQRHDRDLVLHGRETGHLVRTAGGGFFEVHAPLSPDPRWPLVAPEVNGHSVTSSQAPSHRRKAHLSRLRAVMSRFYFDHVETPTPAQVAAALNDDALDEAALKEETHVAARQGGA